jgi:hypothetical protein
MPIPAAVVTTVASQIPWKDVIAAAPDVWKSAKELFAFSTRKAETPAVDPSADIRVQLAGLGSRVQESEQAQAEQAKLIAAIAGQMQAMATQLEASASRATRVMWVAIAGCGLSVASLVTVLAVF